MIWKDIEGFENYQVSNTGRIRCKERKVSQVSRFGGRYERTIRSREMKLQFNADGYHIICLCVENKSHTKRVNRLVAEAFIDNPENKPVVNHKDLNKTNNNSNNLEWVTVMENTHHYWKNKKK